MLSPGFLTGGADQCGDLLPKIRRIGISGNAWPVSVLVGPRDASRARAFFRFHAGRGLARAPIVTLTDTCNEPDAATVRQSVMR